VNKIIKDRNRLEIDQDKVGLKILK